MNELATDLPIEAHADTGAPRTGQLNGGLSFLNGGRPYACRLEGVSLDRFMEGYVFFAVREFSRKGAGSKLFHAKQSRDGERWTRAETRFLVHAWPSELSVPVICALLDRHVRGVRQAAHTLGLKRAG